MKTLVASLIGLTFILTGCFNYTTTVYKSSIFKRNSLTVKIFTSSSCGCTDIFAQKFEKGKLMYEFYYGCTPFFSRRKVVYKYGKGKKPIEVKRFIPTQSDTFDLKFDDIDHIVLQKIDSIRLNQNKLRGYGLCKIVYKGFKISN